MHAIKRTIVEAQTKFQHMEIIETPAYGKVLILDGRIQSSQAEDFIYHEALVHPGMLASERGSSKAPWCISGRCFLQSSTTSPSMSTITARLTLG